MSVNVIKNIVNYNQLDACLFIYFDIGEKVYSAGEENIEISAPAAILMEPKTGKVIYEKILMKYVVVHL